MKDKESAEKAGVKFIGVTYGWQLERERGKIHMQTVKGLLTRLIREKRVVELRALRKKVIKKKLMKKNIRRK